MGTGTDDRYTPPWLLARVTAFLGAGWFDPCPASFGRAPEVNGLAIPWRGNAYVNGPFSNLDPWAIKFLAEPIHEGLFLARSFTGAPYVQRLAASCPMLMFRKRIHFIDPNTGREMGSPNFDCVLFYRGPDEPRFTAAFNDLGCITYPRTQPIAARQPMLVTIEGAA